MRQRASSAKTIVFDLWLGFEHWQPQSEDDPTDDFANINVSLLDGRRYALNVWTFTFLERARYPWPYEKGVGESSEFLLPPDLFVARLDRPTIERAIGQLLADDEMRSEWLCPSDDDEDV